jgi:hypothetical protein
MFRRPRALAAAAAAIAVSAVGAAPASADLGLLSDCDTPDSSAVFSPWLDSTPYFLAPDGGFENGAAGWSVDGGDVVAGNESYNLSGSGSSSLRLQGGDSATSPAVCVGLEHPTFRFVARKVSGTPLSSMTVSVVLPSGSSLPVGAVGSGSSWQPSPVMLVAANLLPLITGGSSTDVAFRFAPTSGTWQIDDVYVDPRGGN